MVPTLTLAEGDAPPGGADDGAADVLLPASGLDELLRESDYVVQAVQWTPETDQMLGKAQFEVSSPQPSEHSRCGRCATRGRNFDTRSAGGSAPRTVSLPHCSSPAQYTHS